MEIALPFTAQVVLAPVAFLAVVYAGVALIWALAKNDYLVTVISEGRVKIITRNEAFYKCVMSFAQHIFASQLPRWNEVSDEKPEGEEVQIVITPTRGKRGQRLKRPGKPEFEKRPLKRLFHEWDIIDATNPWSMAELGEDEQIDRDNEDNKKLEREIRNIPREENQKLHRVIARLFLLDRVRIVGLLPMYQIETYEFRWVSLEEGADPATGGTREIAVEKRETLNYLLLKDDVYLTTVKTAETQELVPLDLRMALTARIRNGYKPLYRGQHWLELLVNQLRPRVRRYIGTQKFEEIINPLLDEKISGESRAERLKEALGEEMLTDFLLGGIRHSLWMEYGIRVLRVQILAVDPGSRQAERFVEASARPFIADREARANRIEGEGLADRAETYYGRVAGIRAGPAMLAAEAYLKNDKVNVYAPGVGGGVLPTVDVSTQSPPPQPPQQPSADNSADKGDGEKGA